MGFFRSLFTVLLLINAAFLGYDYYKGGDIAVQLAHQARQLDVPTIQSHAQYAWAELKATTPEKLAGHVNNAFAQVKDFNSPQDVLQYLRDRVSGAVSKDGAAITYEDGVLVLTDANFKTVIDGSRPALVEFYAPWCGHCKNLAPVYAQLGEAYAYAQDQVVVAKLNADQYRDLGQEFGVAGFPTLKWFPKGVSSPEGVEDYRSGRDLDSLANFIRDKTGLRPRIKAVKSDVTVLTSANFDAVVKNPDLNVLVEFYAPWCGHCKNLGNVFLCSCLSIHSHAQTSLLS